MKGAANSAVTKKFVSLEY